MNRLALVVLAVVASQAYAKVNVAKGKEASQSSIWSITNPASYIVDGDTASTFRTGGHCGHTGMEDGPYFQVDLGDSYLISSVELWTRAKDMGDSYEERDKDFEVRIGNSPYYANNPVCVKFDGRVARQVSASCGSGPLCGRYISVQRAASGYSYMHLCELMAYSDDGKAGCVDEEEYSGTCTCSGDPHCQSFDGTWLHFQGACKYTLARDSCKDGNAQGDPGWEVIANFDRQGSTVSYVRQVTLHLYEEDIVIDMFQNREVHVNGQKLLGSPVTYGDDTTVTITPNHVYITIQGGIRLKWDGDAMVQIEVQEAMKGKVCGLCGNFDGDGSNDWTVGDSELCMEKFPDADAGDATDDLNVFGTSWTAAIDEDEAACSNECPQPPPPTPTCEDMKDQQALDHCAPLKDPNGPFKDCLAKMEQALIDDIFFNCVYDACSLKDYENPICQHGASMSQVCQGGFSVTVTWRGSTGCEPECGDGMVFKECGDACVPTCTDATGENCGNLGPCTEGCFCKDGLVYNQDGACVEPDDCGCKLPGTDIVIPIGESYTTEDCSQICTCEEEGGTPVCKDQECPTNEVCLLRDGDYGCYCEPPFIKPEGECIELPYPCDITDDDGNTETQDLQCLTCKNAGSLEDCEKSGTKETCGGADPICYSEIVKNGDQQVKKVNRACGNRKSCSDASIGPDAKDCVFDGGKSTCKNCGYGELVDAGDDNEIFSCAVVPTEPPVDICTLNKDGGSGKESKKRYYFSMKKCKCTTFTYKGSGGNENNFASKGDCEAKCEVFTPPSECLEPKDEGEGDDRKKWYYFDTKKNACKKLFYKGSGGNNNRFKKKADCRETCKRC